MAENFKKEERKKQIKEVAIDLIGENGYKNTSVQDILDVMDYSKSGFYHCYESKSELLKDIMLDGFEYRNKKMLEQKNGNEKDKNIVIETLIDKIFDCNKYKKIYCVLNTEMPNNEELKSIYKFVVDDIKNNFLEFCDKNGFEDYLKINTEEFLVFLNSLIVGVSIYEQYDNENYKDLIREMLVSYFEKKLNKNSK